VRAGRGHGARADLEVSPRLAADHFPHFPLVQLPDSQSELALQPTPLAALPLLPTHLPEVQLPDSPSELALKPTPLAALPPLPALQLRASQSELALQATPFARLPSATADDPPIAAMATPRPKQTPTIQLLLIIMAHFLCIGPGQRRSFASSSRVRRSAASLSADHI